MSSGSLLCFEPFALGESAPLGISPSDAKDESQIIYLDAKIAANRGDYSEALLLAERSLVLNPESLEAAELIFLCAKKLNRTERIRSIEPVLKLARDKDQMLKSATTQLELATQDLASDRLSDSIRRLDFVAGLSSLRDGGGFELIEEARFKRGMARMEQEEVSEALESLMGAGQKYRQRSAYIVGNYLYQHGYLGQAYSAYQKAADLTRGEKDLEVAKSSREMLSKLGSFGLEFRASSLVVSDSNPFGFPESQPTYNGVTNQSRSLATNANLSIKAPVNDQTRILFRGLLGAGQSHAFSRDYRQTLDSETANLGASAYLASLGTGRANFRYLFQYSRAPFETDPGIFLYTPSLRQHIFAFDLSREMSRRIDFRLNYRFVHSDIPTSSDIGTFDRSSVTYGVSWSTVIKTRSRWIKPTVTVAADLVNANGDSVAHRIFSGTFYNYMPLSRRLELEVSGAVESDQFYRYLGGRSDRIWRFSSSVAFAFNPHLGLLGQFSYSDARSTVSYYNQIRIVSAIGLTVSFL